VITLRPAIPDDLQFIVSGWSSSYRMSRDCTTPMALYARQKHEEVRYYLDHSAEVIVAEGSVLQGFIAFERPDYVFYVYVPQPFRGRGIARQLFYAAGIDPSSRFEYHARTRASWECRHKIPLAVHNSLRARFPKENHEQRECDQVRP
jgi:hypothetical protein